MKIQISCTCVSLDLKKNLKIDITPIAARIWRGEGIHAWAQRMNSGLLKNTATFKEQASMNQEMFT